MQRIAEAKRSLEKALRHDPSCAVAYFWLGPMSTDPSEAIGYYQKMLRLQPSASIVHYPLGLPYCKVGDVEQSLYHLDRRGNAQPQMPDVLISELSRLRTGNRARIAQAALFMRRGQLREAAFVLE